MTKDRYIRIRLSQADRKLLEALAKEQDYTISFYIRDLIYKDAVKQQILYKGGFKW